MESVFLRVLADDDKASALRRAIGSGRDDSRFEVEAETFKTVHGSPFAYWVVEEVRRLFQTLPQFESHERTAKQGLATADDFRFLRLWTEAPTGAYRATWFPFAKGGKFSPFYADLHLLVNWADNGRELKAWADPLYGNSGWSRIIKSTQLYFKPGLTWPLRTHRFAPYPLPKDSIFSVRGYSAFVPNDQLLPTLAVFNSGVFDYLFKISLGWFSRPEFIVGLLNRLPWPEIDASSSLGPLARRAWAVKRIIR